MRSKRVSAVLLAGLAALFVGFGAAPAFASHGPQTPSTAPVTDYAKYPLGLGIIPAGCTAQGGEILVGEQYSINGGAPQADLRNVGEIANDAVVTMTWTGYAQGCEGIGLSLSRKVAPSPAFDPSVNQYVNAWSYCGPGGNACNGTLTLDLSTTTGVACYQLDASVGPPLNVVGPAGAFYSLNGKFNTLLSANNGGTQPCIPAPCVEAGAPADMPATAADCDDVAVTTITTARPAATTTTTAPAAVSPTTASTTPTPVAASTPAAVSPTTIAAVGAQALPRTGSSTTDMARLGAALAVAGLLMVAATRRWRLEPIL